MVRSIALATAVAGTLDILFAMILTVWFGREIPNMLRFGANEWGAAGAALGLVVHFTLMAIMATVFVLLVRWRPILVSTPLLTGIGYGLATYVVMNWIVVPLRFDSPLPPKPISIATQLFAHIVLVGIPFALIAARTLRNGSLMERATT